jgi:hypothetical protein
VVLAMMRRFLVTPVLRCLEWFPVLTKSNLAVFDRLTDHGTL